MAKKTVPAALQQMANALTQVSKKTARLADDLKAGRARCYRDSEFAKPRGAKKAKKR